MTTDDDQITLITFNHEHDGKQDPDNWAAAHELLRQHRPDVVFRQEMTHSHLKNNHLLHQAESILGLRGFLSQYGQGRNPTGMYINPRVFHVQQHFDNHDLWRTPPTNLLVNLPEVPDVPIVLVSWHLAFNSTRRREIEADEIAALVDKTKQGFAFIGAGDCNEYPYPWREKVTLPDWDNAAELWDRTHWWHRTTETPQGTRESATYLDRMMHAVGMHDPARYAAYELGQDDALDPTAGHLAQGQGGGRRIDRFYLDPWTVRAVQSVEVVRTDQVSDHHIVKVVLSRSEFVKALRRVGDPHPPLVFGRG